MNLTRPLVAGASVAAVALAVSLTALPSPAEAKLMCKPMVTGKAVHISKKKAILFARGNWKAKTAGLYGAAYANYNKAKSKSTKCKKRLTKYVCYAKGRPCK